MTETKEIYSEKAAGINQAIDKIVKKIRVPFISDCENTEILELFDIYKDEPSRNYIQKYAETEMNNFSSKLGKTSWIFALFALVLIPLQMLMPVYYPKFYEQPNDIGFIFIKIDIFLIVCIIIWMIKINFEKNLLKIIIMKIEDYKLNKQKEEVLSITPKIEIPEKDLKIKVEKFDLNLSISTER